DEDRLARLVMRVAVDQRDAVDDVLPLDDLAEDRVLPVEPRARVRSDDEELRAVRIRAGVRHGQCTALDSVLVELVVEAVAGPAGPVAAWAAALDHEAGDHAMEHPAVVEPL